MTRRLRPHAALRLTAQKQRLFSNHNQVFITKNLHEKNFPSHGDFILDMYSVNYAALAAALSCFLIMYWSTNTTANRHRPIASVTAPG